MDDTVNTEDTISILVATDNHLGFLESDPERGGDSFVAFDEVLALARTHDVDLILLGGDLFHHAKPTPTCLLRAARSLREHCLGDKPVALELLSAPADTFTRPLNYEDPNLNVAYPVLSIHGNHDDPVSGGATGSLDILADTGLLNYCGKGGDYSRVRLAPALLRKGRTHLALYALSHIKDQRLARLLREDKVELQRPDAECRWFNLLVLHQNRADRGPRNYVPEDALPDFLDLVIWGHEHDCRVREEFNPHRNFYVTQPGSTVATSLAAGEALPKHCALLHIYMDKFRLTPLPLKTVRPFIFRTIVLSEELASTQGAPLQQSEHVQEHLRRAVMEAAQDARTQLSGHPAQPTLPLVRLNVLFEHEGQDFNRVRFGQQFAGVVANPQDVLLMKRERRVAERRHAKNEGGSDDEALASAVRDALAGAGPGEGAPDVETLVLRYYAEAEEERRPRVLSELALTDAVKEFTLKNNDEAFRRVIEAHRSRALKLLMGAAQSAETEAEVQEQLAAAKRQLNQADVQQLRAMVAEPPTPTRSPPEPERPRVEVRGRGGRGSRARAGRSPRGARAAPASTTWLADVGKTRPRTTRAAAVVIDDDSD